MAMAAREERELAGATMNQPSPARTPNTAPFRSVDAPWCIKPSDDKDLPACEQQRDRSVGVHPSLSNALPPATWAQHWTQAQLPAGSLRSTQSGLSVSPGVVDAPQHFCIRLLPSHGDYGDYGS
ncbi:hypothetical protein G7Z17_g10684 [Cylindrodendrum hubeiense]|uniref:Uncharacterized protein n=1 Tax=Cylindrodendrum hubeiense TaxID=595255 RepID=A0A9P5L722_9HYPO|nr:hypothetical protein G7Z17_g10684 [Cylindrodendrum hubeiense]